MKIVAIIPARLASSRYPRKPLAQILGLPMLEHVRRRTALCEALSGVYVATCDDDIRSVIEGYGGQVIMTSPAHERGTDRIAEAAQSLGLSDDDIVVNVQGDEPLVRPEMIDLALEPLLSDAGVACTNLISPFESTEEIQGTDEIKVVKDLKGDALYMSRAAIPTNTRGTAVEAFKQVCVIGFRYGTLRRFQQLEQTPLERAESIDMLRLMENGIRVKTVFSNFRTQAVDTRAGRDRVEALMRSDPLFPKYGSISARR